MSPPPATPSLRRVIASVRGARLVPTSVPDDFGVVVEHVDDSQQVSSAAIMDAAHEDNYVPVNGSYAVDSELQLWFRARTAIAYGEGVRTPSDLFAALEDKGVRVTDDTDGTVLAIDMVHNDTIDFDDVFYDLWTEGYPVSNVVGDARGETPTVYVTADFNGEW